VRHYARLCGQRGISDKRLHERAVQALCEVASRLCASCVNRVQVVPSSHGLERSSESRQTSRWGYPRPVLCQHHCPRCLGEPSDTLVLPTESSPSRSAVPRLLWEKLPDVWGFPRKRPADTDVRSWLGGWRDFRRLSVPFTARVGRGRGRHCWRPPAQIPACGTTALGSCLGFWRRSERGARDALRVFSVAIGQRGASSVPR